MADIQDIKFCLNCGLPFDKKWNKKLDNKFKNEKCCCTSCQKTYNLKEKRISEKSAPKHGVLS